MGKVSKALSKAGADADPVISGSVEPGGKKQTGALSQPVTKDKSNKHSPHIPLQTTEGWDERFANVSEKFPGVLESFRRLRTKIIHPAQGEPAKSILVTSAAQGAGKSFVCANLGTIMAQGVDQHALMVDCDLRRPTLAHLFGVDGREGLADHLRDGTDLSTLIRKTSLNRLSLIPAGIPPQNPSELLTSEKMPALVNELVGRYHDRFIILDSPPAQAASETAILAQHVDKVVIVVRWGGAGREQVKRLVEQIGREKILGVVFNAFEMNILDKKMKGEGYENYYSEGY